jgi:hypothetical protein
MDRPAPIPQMPAKAIASDFRTADVRNEKAKRLARPVVKKL